MSSKHALISLSSQTEALFPSIGLEVSNLLTLSTRTLSVPADHVVYFSTHTACSSQWVNQSQRAQAHNLKDPLHFYDAKTIRFIYLFFFKLRIP